MGMSGNFQILREGFTPQPLSWYSVEDCLPKIREDDYGINQSKRVLMLMKGGVMLVGYLQQWDDYSPEWVQCGRDGYKAENVTHWRWLPMPPNQSAEPQQR